MAENPTVLVSQSKSQVGLLAEDTISRLQFQAQADRDRAEFSLNHIAIQPGQTRMLRWAIYPMQDTDYFAFINQIRRDWESNFTVFGPWDFFDVTTHSELLHNPVGVQNFEPLRAPDGRYVYELYYRGKKRDFSMMAILVYAAPGNELMNYWLDQAHFMMEEVGLDGIYIDQFSLAFTTTPDYSEPTKVSQRYSYDRWDGLTVDIDPATGKIIRRYTDGAFVGVGVRKALMEYVLSQGGIMVANTHCAVEELQSVPVVRFMGAEWVFDRSGWEKKVSETMPR